ncbi:MAG: hypothetical protein ABIN67_11825, partial [Ferruginibacter sp.]
LQHRNLITTLKYFNPQPNNSTGTKQQPPKRTEGRSFSSKFIAANKYSDIFTLGIAVSLLQLINTQIYLLSE